VVVKSPIYSEETTRELFLLECLTSLNHTRQINLFNDKISTPNNQVRAFLFINQCPHSQSWMLRRIIHEIYTPRFPVEIKPLNKKNNHPHLPISELQVRFEREAKFLDVSNKQIIFTLNIDNYDPDAVKSIIENCWLRVLKSANEIRRNSVLLFLMDHKLGKNWQNNNSLQSYMAELPFHLPNFGEFQEESQELGTLISTIATRFIKEEFEYNPQEKPSIIAEILINQFKKHYQTLNLFAQICEYFNCCPQKFNQEWQNYYPKPKTNSNT